MFRRVLGEPANAASQLRAVLPAGLVGRLDLARLRRVPGSFVPAVSPLVVHHNRRRWSGPTELADLLDLDRDAAEAAGEYLPRLRFLLDDLAGLDESVLRARPVTPPVRLTLLLLKIAAGNARLAADLRRWAEDLRAVLDRPGGIEDFVAVVTYIESVVRHPPRKLHDLFTQLGPTAEEAYVTTAEMLHAEMLHAEGEARGRAEALVQLLSLKFGRLDAWP